MKNVIVLIAQVKYPSVDYTYLTADSFVMEKGSIRTIDEVTADFRRKVETDGFTITNFLVYVVPQEHVTECLPPRSLTHS